jgi:uncharacterized phage protein (TIGR02218 family)
MNYLNRPVFTLPIDWSGRVNRAVQYDQRARRIGFGANVAEPQQLHAANLREFTVDLPDACAVNALERFAQSVGGRLRGFWIPGPERLEIAAGASGVSFDILAQGLAETWDDDPAIHLAFFAPDDSMQCAAISSVASISGEIERVTLAAALADPATAAHDARRLYYVRFADDELEMRFDAPGVASSQIKVFELPIEYSAVELGQRPAFCYHFWRTAGEAREDWYFTSFDEAVYAGPEESQTLHQPRPIGHGELSRGVGGEREELKINTWRFADNPLNAWLPFAPQYDFFVEVTEVLLGDTVQGDETLLFSGLVERVEPKGQALTVTCSTRLDRLSTSLPRFRIQRACNYVLYGPCCKVSRAAFSVEAAVAGIDARGLSLLLSAPGLDDLPSGWFAFGDAKSHDANGLREFRAIVGSTTGAGGSDQHSIQLSAPFSRKPEIGDTINIAAGCDLSHVTCEGKFANFANFGGHPFIDENLSLKAIKLNQDGGGKGGGK